MATVNDCGTSKRTKKKLKIVELAINLDSSVSKFNEELLEFYPNLIAEVFETQVPYL